MYYYFEPRNWRTREGERHIKSKELGINVKLLRPQNSGRKTHPAHAHCMRIRRDGEIIASIVGPAECVVFGQDDKCKVPVGVAAAVKQTPILMNSRRQVRLPDHSMAKGPKHKLTPSVIVASPITYDKHRLPGDAKCVKTVGPVYVANRSMAHSTSSAFTHGFDIYHIISEAKGKQIRTAFYGPKKDDPVKPVWIASNDGGTDLQG